MCGESLPTESAVTLALQLVDGGAQALPVHWDCFAAVLHPSVPTLDREDYG